MSNISAKKLTELSKLFLKIGLIGFGGPAAHIAMMEDEIVNRRQWLTRSHFLDLVGATNLIPGPNSTEMAIHIGYIYGGFFGLILAGICFIFPAAFITFILAYIYQEFGTLPQVEPLFYGIKPVVVAIIAIALYRLGKKAVKNRQLLLIAFGVILFICFGINEIIALLLGGILGMVWLQFTSKKFTNLPWLMVGLSPEIILINNVSNNQNLVTPSLWQLGLFFVKIGSILFGSGYVLVAFLQGELVDKYHWLTTQQVLDAIAIGQFTPGPVLSTATFIGYLILGLPGAIISTIAIFLPSFFFVAALNPLIPKLRQSSWASSFLDAVNVSSVALMVVVTFNLAQAIFLQSTATFSIDITAVFMVVISLILLLRFQINSAWLILGGAIIGWLVFII